VSEWSKKRIKDITVKVGSGATPRGGQSVYIDKGYALIRSQNVYDYTFEKEGLVFIGEEHAEKLKNATVEENDILLNITGDSVGRCCIVPNDILPARVNQHVAIIRTNAENNPKYLMYYLNNPVNKERLLNQVHGGTRKALTKGIIEEFEVEIPSLKKQNEIVSILDSLDEKIKLNLKMNETLQEIAMTLYKHWFVDFGPFQDGEFVESELGIIPKGWKVSSLKEFANILMGQSPKSEFYNQEKKGLPFHQGVKDFGARFPVHTVYCTQELRIANKGDILLSVRAPVGRINIANNKLVIGRGLSALHAKSGHNSFLLYTLKRIFAFEDQYGSGTVFNSINKKDIEQLKFIQPPQEVLDNFEKHVSKFDSLIESNTKEIEELQELRDYLLPRLLSGEIDLSKAEKQVEKVL
jgi:type I restriction enzyme, S subunit